jgi:acyl dehydratase
MQTPAALQARIGQEIGLSDWLAVDQGMIDRFADLTGDHQYIHVDPVAAARTPFGGTIAHGFLVLSLLAQLGASADFVLEGASMGMNYGFEKVRMTGPVRAGKRIRGRFVLQDFVERAPKQWLATLLVTVEIEDEPRPALVAEWLCLQFIA